MKHVSFHFVLLLVQIYLVSELESRNITGNGAQAGHLIKTKSGKIFLQHSSKNPISSKKDTTYGGQDYSNDDEIQVTISAVDEPKKCGIHCIFCPSLGKDMCKRDKSEIKSGWLTTLHEACCSAGGGPTSDTTTEVASSEVFTATTTTSTTSTTTTT